MTNSEKLANLINTNHFFKEFSYFNTQISNETVTEIELADLIVTFDRSLIIFQLKERNTSFVADEKTEEKWFNNKVLKKAKDQIVNTYDYLSKFTNIPLINNRGHKIYLNLNHYSDIYNIIIYDESNKLSNHLINKKGVTSSKVDFIHLMPLKAYKTICEYLHTPVEIMEYFRFREVNYLKSEEINEAALLGYYFSGEYKINPSQDQEILLQRYKNQADEFEMNFLLASFYDKIIGEIKSTEYYEIIKSIAMLNRNELLEFKKRFSLSIKQSHERNFHLPYRITLPRIDCGFVFIPFPYEQTGDLLIALSNFTQTHKYNHKLDKCVGVIIRKEENNEFYEIYWCLIEHPWSYDDLLEKHLKENFPFRTTQPVFRPKY